MNDELLELPKKVRINLPMNGRLDMLRFAGNVKLVAITGGPCGGKSTFMPMAKAMLTKNGVLCFIISEAARELIAAGFHPAHLEWKRQTAFQELVFETTVRKEEWYFQSLDLINRGDQPVVFLCDRGFVDGEAYVGEKAFNEILKKMCVSRAKILDHYDGVIALVSSANGAEKYYICDDERTENLEQARQLDHDTIRAWHDHQHISVVDNSTDFPTKMNRALQALRRVMGVPMAQERERKFLIRNFTPALIPADAKLYKIEQRYLNRPDRPGIECRVRCKTTDTSSYYYTEKVATALEGERGESEEVITRERCRYLLEHYLDLSCDEIKKTRYKFQVDAHMFELDVYEEPLAGLVILEVEFKSPEEMKAFTLPTLFAVQGKALEVTNDKRYSNRQLAEHGLPFLTTFM